MKNKTKEIKADWEDFFDNKFCYLVNKETGELMIGYIDPKTKQVMPLEAKSIKDFIQKNFVAKGEVREMLDDFVETLIFNREHNFHDEQVVFSDSIILELMNYLKLKSLE